MTPLFKNKYRIATTRLKNWDYSWNGMYFITICTEHMNHYFGEINPDGEIKYSASGKIACQIWELIPNQFPFVELGEFIIMPNHVHGILIINDENNRDIKKEINPSRKGGITGNKNPMLNENISRIIRWYKGRTSFEIRKILKVQKNESGENLTIDSINIKREISTNNTSMFCWQSRFYDRRVYSHNDLITVSNYIINNPKKWVDDKK